MVLIGAPGQVELAARAGHVGHNRCALRVKKVDGHLLDPGGTAPIRLMMPNVAIASEDDLSPSIFCLIFRNRSTGSLIPSGNDRKSNPNLLPSRSSSSTGRRFTGIKLRIFKSSALFPAEFAVTPQCPRYTGDQNIVDRAIKCFANGFDFSQDPAGQTRRRAFPCPAGL